MLDTSPVAGYRAAYDGPLGDPSALRAWDRGYASQGVKDDYARTFNSPSHAGGFTLFAVQFPSHHAAVTAGADAYASFVCTFDGDPMAVSRHPDIVFAVRSSDTEAWWVRGSLLIELDYSMFGDRTQDERDALVVLQQAWALGS
jgi:hypothetical protein